ncbi:class I SAM-dependent methyltransferase [Lusitaniella coriacea]|uniref:class I SAM-dependent methyltransferase n=1 Tax=Lusitaniella coriacea TaxID=1983105 RepID=UPI003CF35668
MAIPPKPYKEYIQSNIEDYVAHYRKFVGNEPEMTKLLRKLLENRIDTSLAYRLLDIGCGNGNTMYHLNSHFSHWNYTGIDVVQQLVEEGNRLFAELNNIELRVGDAYTSDREFSQPFDIVLLWRVLSGLEDWQRAIASAHKTTRKGGHLIIATLLNENNVDIAMTRRDYSAPGEIKEAPLRIFSLPKFKEFCKSLGIQDFFIQPFEMPIHLPRPEKGLSTFTVQLEDERYLQISGGALIDHWKIIHIVV